MVFRAILFQSHIILKWWRRKKKKQVASNCWNILIIFYRTNSLECTAQPQLHAHFNFRSSDQPDDKWLFSWLFFIIMKIESILRVLHLLQLRNSGLSIICLFIVFSTEFITRSKAATLVNECMYLSKTCLTNRKLLKDDPVATRE